MKLAYNNGVTSVVLRMKILSTAVSTGAGLTGLTSGSTGLIISTIADNEATPTAYTVAGSTIETITTLGTFAAPTATKCRFKEVDATNHPGVYEIQIANARWSVSNARSVIVSVSGATNAAQVDAEIQLDPVPANVIQISDDATAADNAEAFFDGTGYAGTNNVIPVVTTLNGLAEGVITAASIAANALAAAKFAADAITAIQAGLATAAQINSLAINTRANLHVPVEIETPDASTQVYKIRLHLFDVEGNMEAPDSTPTIALTNAAGTDRSSRLSAASNPSSGVYTWDYTATAGDAEEQLVWVFTVVEGTLIRTYPATSYVVEESAYRFSSSDRATLQAAATQISVNDLPTNAELATALGTADDATIAAIAAEAVKTAAIKTKTDQLVFTVANRVDATATIAAADIRTALGMAAANLDTQLAAILAAASSGSGTGARTVTITVNDGATVLQNAIVRMTDGVNSYTAITNVSGVAVFNLDDATWTVSITKVGYTYAGTTIVVNGTETATYSMTAIVVTPGAGNLTTGYLTVLSSAGVAVASAEVKSKAVSPPSAGTGYAHSATERTVTADSDGLCEFTGLTKGATYLFWLGDDSRLGRETTIPAGAGSTYALPDLVGE